MVEVGVLICLVLFGPDDPELELELNPEGWYFGFVRGTILLVVFDRSDELPARLVSPLPVGFLVEPAGAAAVNVKV